MLLPAYPHPRQQHGLLILLVPAACDGDWMEFGVYTGGSVNKTANWRRRHCPQSCPPVYGFDTFTGGAMALHANLMRELVTARQIAVRAQCLAASSKHAHLHADAHLNPPEHLWWPKRSTCPAGTASEPLHVDRPTVFVTWPPHVQAWQRTGTLTTRPSSPRAASPRAATSPPWRTTSSWSRACTPTPCPPSCSSRRLGPRASDSVGRTTLPP